MARRSAGALTRRELLAGTASGVMLGSAWAAAFRATTVDARTPAVTVVVNGAAFAALIQFDGVRVLALDTDDPEQIATLSEVVTGVMKQRIDMLLATTPTLGALPPSWRERWRTGTVLQLPDQVEPPIPSLATQSIRVGGMIVAGDSLPHGLWRQRAQPEAIPWYLAVALGDARLVVASDGVAVSRLPIDADRVTGVVCNDRDLQASAIRQPIDLLAVPVGADVPAADIAGTTPVTVLLHPDQPRTFRLGAAGIDVPAPL